MKNKYILWILIAVIIAGIGYWYWYENVRIIKISRGTPRGTVTEMKYIIMKHFGLDKKHGLDIDFPVFDPGELERRFFSGETGGLGGMSPLVASKANLEDKKVRILSAELQMNYYIAVRNDSNIRTLEDLKGKRVGVLPKATAAYSSLALILLHVGINPDTDLSLTFGPIPEMVKLVREGRADAAMVSYPTAASLFASGEFRFVADLEKIWEESHNTSHPFVVMVAFEDWLRVKENRRTVKRFVEASNETAQLIKDTPELLTDESIPGIKEFLEKNGLNSEETKKLLRENAPEFIYSEWGEKEVEAVGVLLSHAKEESLLPADAPDDIIIGPSEL
ncbi:MAG: hypothetical protein A2931_01300 [Candidatus Niyogibacteria bacterium RIFCSPLOWO2_01_FULL_45_48]|uniref:SsuA/THI5-like domain-containing protein n=2 Tax=Candidatus Niyogiibacteriota TaxID=1817912 RepID=A0A1G2EXA8_9BACT|nr:MAG: hypothetical protein A2835_01530 [Candidatus Niyogibacteria bacterium RIFCSPHIGHO2_01_FULL_45_28]OGZ29689.1 MAG: hypothetical protein A2931_01300 [Candidatus Niyogibacteria bacterium RIFCSPLOWO2_01_FULL_45_48]OGZ30444.1 MAG: hypothetical protein A3J00_04210 [Candidatus Niyogibacteria bacterium RIFCSPLOWO2_02_FULL_45_13]